MKRINGFVSDENLNKERRVLSVQSKIITILRKVKPEKRGNVIRAVAAIYGYEV